MICFLNSVETIDGQNSEVNRHNDVVCPLIFNYSKIVLKMK